MKRILFNHIYSTLFVVIILVTGQSSLAVAVRAPDRRSEDLPVTTKIFSRFEPLLPFVKMGIDYKLKHMIELPGCKSLAEVSTNIEDYLTTDIDNILQNVAYQDLKQLYVHYSPSNAYGANEMFFVSYQQESYGDKIEGATLTALIANINDSCLATVKSNFIPSQLLPIPLNPLTNQKINEVKEALGLPQKSQAIFGEGVVRFIKEENAWKRFKVVEFSGSPYRGLVDQNGNIYAEDKRIYLVKPPIISGLSYGRGYAADPTTVSGNNLDTMFLEDLEIRLIGLPDIAYTISPYGQFYFPTITTSQTIDATLKGRWAQVFNQAFGPSSPNLSYTDLAIPGIREVVGFNLTGNNEFDIAQVNGYFHTTKAHNFVKNYIPTIAGINMSLPVKVNDPNIYCNAFYTMPFGTTTPSIKFARSSGPCPNFAFDGIIYHEYGHFVDDRLGGMISSALSEGWGDLLAAFVTGRANFASGLPEEFQRRADNDYIYPPDAQDEEHSLGQAWAALGWFTRENLIISLGQQQGIAVGNDIFMNTLLSNSPNIPVAVFDVFIVDDLRYGDGNIANGTPHMYEIGLAAAQRNLWPFLLFGDIDNVQRNQIITSSSSPLIITGAASISPGFPHSFHSYALSYHVGAYPDPLSLGWVPITSLITTPVSGPSGQLGTWTFNSLQNNTTYTLRLIVNSVDLPFIIFHYPVIIHHNPLEQTVNINPSNPLLNNSASSSNNPDISGNYIVWNQIDNLGTSNVYLYDTSNGSKQNISNNVSNASSKKAKVDGNYVVWAQENSFGSGHIKLYNITMGTTQVLTTTPLLGPIPNIDISGNNIIWTDGSCGIKRYNITTGVTSSLSVFGGSSCAFDPKISDNNVVWTSSSPGLLSTSIVHHDLNTNLTQVIPTAVSSEKYYPDISGSTVVWQDNRNGNRDIYSYDLLTGIEQQITSSSDHETDPAIFGNIIVYVKDNNKNFDIHAYDLSTGLDQAVTGNLKTIELNPAIWVSSNGSQKRLVWQSTLGGGFDSYILFENFNPDVGYQTLNVFRRDL